MVSGDQGGIFLDAEAGQVSDAGDKYDHEAGCRSQRKSV